jgi:hypothetical protein
MLCTRSSLQIRTYYGETRATSYYAGLEGKSPRRFVIWELERKEPVVSIRPYFRSFVSRLRKLHQLMRNP